jgi:hypothetical protein
MHRAHGRQSGMSLIEVAVTIVLLTLTIFPIYTLLLSSRMAVSESRTYGVARVALDHQLERLQAMANESDTAFAGLSLYVANNPTFTIAGIPEYRDAVGALTPNGRMIRCLDEGKKRFTVAEGAYFASAPWNDPTSPLTVYPTQTCVNPNLPAASLYLDANLTGTDLDSADRNGNGVFNDDPLVDSDKYRLLPVRVECYWGNVQLRPQDAAPKIWFNMMIGPKTKFRRG